MRGPRTRDVLVAVSLANLAMIDVWGLLLYAGEGDRYYLPLFGAPDHAAALLLLALASLAAYALLRLTRRVAHPALTGAALLLAGALLLNPVEYARASMGVTRLELLHFAGAYGLASQVPLAVTALGLAALALRRARLVGRAAFAALLLISPLALSNAAQSAWRGLSAWREAPPPGAETGDASARARASAGGARSRAVFLVFDELDFRLAFPDRPAGVALPELDRLRTASFFAHAAQEPGGHTGTSIPALLTGTRVLAARPRGASRLDLELEGGAGAVVAFAEQENLFGRAARRGLSVGIVGIYHPYCRLFPAAWSRCHFDPFLPGGGVADTDTFAGILARQAYKLLPLLDYRGEHIASIERTLAIATELAADPDLDVVFAHLPVPHAPYVYDRERDAFTIFNFRRDAYFDQLVLADRSLGAIRRAMEASGVFDRSALLVTSDHGWRFAAAHGMQRDHRVPLLLKLPGRADGLDYDRPFPAWEASALLLATLDGELQEAADVASWLDGRREESSAPIRAAAAAP